MKIFWNGNINYEFILPDNARLNILENISLGLPQTWVHHGFVLNMPIYFIKNYWGWVSAYRWYYCQNKLG